jgi:hypothetical protein
MPIGVPIACRLTSWNTGLTPAIAIDEHSRRLDRIEKRLGLDVEHH